MKKLITTIIMISIIMNCLYINNTCNLTINEIKYMKLEQHISKLTLYKNLLELKYKITSNEDAEREIERIENLIVHCNILIDSLVIQSRIGKGHVVRIIVEIKYSDLKIVKD